MSPKGVSPVVDVVVVQVVIVKREGERVGTYTHTHTSKGRPGFLFPFYNKLSERERESRECNHASKSSVQISLYSNYIFASLGFTYSTVKGQSSLMPIRVSLVTRQKYV